MTEHIPPLPEHPLRFYCNKCNDLVASLEHPNCGYMAVELPHSMLRHSDEALIAYAKAYHEHHSAKDRELLEQAKGLLQIMCDTNFGEGWIWPQSARVSWKARALEVIDAITKRLKEQST